MLMRASSVTIERRSPRFDADLPVVLVGPLGEIQGRTRNISAGGMLVVAAPIRPGTELSVSIHLPALEGPVLLPATVRWSSPRGEVGLQFGSLRARDVWALNELSRR
jgi:hypothetical protein